MIQRGAKEITHELQNKSEDDDDKPIPLSTSQAATWKAEWNRHPPNPPTSYVWFTPHAIMTSLAIFMIYFCILREENDIDEIMYRPLPETIKGIDKACPDLDFYKKPDYVLYHENKKLKNSSGVSS